MSARNVVTLARTTKLSGACKHSDPRVRGHVRMLPRIPHGPPGAFDTVPDFPKQKRKFHVKIFDFDVETKNL